MQAFGTQKKQIPIEPVLLNGFKLCKQLTDFDLLSQPVVPHIQLVKVYGYLVG
jgi:hypothetical protein